MNVMKSEWRDRVKHWLRVLKADLYEPIGEISWEAARVKEHLHLEEAEKLQYVPVQEGFTWGETWEYCWFRGNVTIPEYANGKRIVLNLDPNGESTLFVNGKSFGTYRADSAINIFGEVHHYMVDNTLTREAKVGDKYEIVMETYAGHYFPEPQPGCAAGPILPVEGMYDDPLTEGSRRVLGKCTYGIWNEDAYQLYMDVETLVRLLSVLDHTSLRAAQIADALEQFTLVAEFEQDLEARTESYRQAREVLRPALEAENGTMQAVFYAIGNAHIDLAWMWPVAETNRKTSRTFAAQLRMMDEYPEYKFIQSQPAAYEMCKKYYPELFERIKEAIRRGQWIAEGGMWVEPDTNMAGGEALIRQLLYGKKYYKEEFGVDSQLLWLPDTFGYTAALPQILKKCGMKYLVTQKIFWSYNEGEQFPYHYFKWQGMDGTEIVSFLPTSYTYRTSPEEVNTVWKNRSQVRDLDAFLLPYGYGDGGGGPARDYVEYAKRQKDLQGGVKIKLSDPLEFFEDMEEKGGPKHTYVGELYFSAHRGTYTTQAMVKKNNRLSELSLRDMEMWSAIAALENGTYPYEAAERLWKQVLFHQFHDILPGSSIARVYEEAESAYKDILGECNKLSDEAKCSLLDENVDNAITVFNSLSFDRKVLVTLPDAYAKGALMPDGSYVPVYKTVEGMKAYVQVPACGTISLLPAASEVESRTDEATVLAVTGGFVLENNQIRAFVNERGEVTSFVRKDSGREFAAGVMNQLRMYKDVPRIFDAWDIDSNYIMQETKGAYDICVEEVSQGIEAVLKVTGKIGKSSYSQMIRLGKESNRLEFETEVDWKELHRLCKVSFPISVYVENGINEMQFGYVERPTHRSKPYDQDRFEVANHRYSALCDGSHGAAVLNDCKYGISMNGNQLELTLLRAAASPEMCTDNRVHQFKYAFTAWDGNFVDCDVVKEGYDFNVPATILNGQSEERSFLDLDKENVFVDAIKLAEDGSGDIIIRLYEAKKAAVQTKMYVSIGSYRAYECDMLENIESELKTEDGLTELSFQAFEIKTIRLQKAFDGRSE